MTKPNRQTKTATNRSLGRYSAVIYFLLLVAIALVSFMLGIVIGKKSAEREMALSSAAQQRVFVVDQSEVAVSEESAQAQQASAESLEVDAAEDERLTFYDDLGKESKPLGSGINLAPRKKESSVKKKPPVEPMEKPAEQEKAAPALSEKAVDPVPAEPATKMINVESLLSQASESGSHVVQIGAFATDAEAQSLRQKMSSKGYPVRVVRVDLGGKGVWHRVRIGPYDGKQEAQRQLQQLRQKEKMDGFVTRQ